MAQSLKENLRSWFFFGLIILAVFAARSVIADWNPVPTGSMKPTILEGDVIIVHRAAYDLKIPFTTRHLAEWGHPQRGDIVVFRSPEDGTRLVKRVIGTPGDRIRLSGDRLWVNGELLPTEPVSAEAWSGLPVDDQSSHRGAIEEINGQQHAILLDGRYPLPYRGSFTIPDGQYFMMGDHRNNSRDSRVFGLVERHLILGRASRVLVSVDTGQRWKPRWHRFFGSLDAMALSSVEPET